MAFSVSVFKAGAAAKGFLRTHSYTVTINPPTGGGGELRLRTENVTLPGASFLTIDGYRPYSSGIIYNIPYSYNPQPISMTHTIDSNGYVLKAFWDWVDKISDLSGEYMHAANYLDEYTARQMNIEVYNQDQSIVKIYTLYDVFPITIDQMEMGWGNNDETAKLNVSYQFSRYKVE